MIFTIVSKDPSSQLEVGDKIELVRESRYSTDVFVKVIEASSDNLEPGDDQLISRQCLQGYDK